MESAELTHYGVKGMKWGVRKARKAQAKFAGKAERQAANDIKDRFKDTYRKQGAGYYPGA